MNMILWAKHCCMIMRKNIFRAEKERKAREKADKGKKSSKDIIIIIIIVMIITITIIKIIMTRGERRRKTSIKPWAASFNEGGRRQDRGQGEGAGGHLHHHHHQIDHDHDYLDHHPYDQGRVGELVRKVQSEVNLKDVKQNYWLIDLTMADQYWSS